MIGTGTVRTHIQHVDIGNDHKVYAINKRPNVKVAVDALFNFEVANFYGHGAKLKPHQSRVAVLGRAGFIASNRSLDKLALAGPESWQNHAWREVKTKPSLDIHDVDERKVTLDALSQYAARSRTSGQLFKFARAHWVHGRLKRS